MSIREEWSLKCHHKFESKCVFPYCCSRWALLLLLFLPLFGRFHSWFVIFYSFGKILLALNNERKGSRKPFNHWLAASALWRARPERHKDPTLESKVLMVFSRIFPEESIFWRIFFDSLYCFVSRRRRDLVVVNGNLNKFARRDNNQLAEGALTMRIEDVVFKVTILVTLELNWTLFPFLEGWWN